ncbi:E3 ubiquitin-protein ligase [Hibiscus syriacus]|uniref:E3 ubiquitin-protein ligase n=1 Tax=Hibiscus syriacus TaxID=106335 RepID=A0A6A3BPA0_HIBSY|nr:E3 ubiquitin-protein ligase [Hibiscus syriacus]
MSFFLSWSASGDGLFSVKSCRNTFGNVFEGNVQWCKGVWLGFAPPRVEAFMWQLAHQKVAVKTELVKRGLSLGDDILCPFYKKQEESVHHLFISCQVVWELWNKIVDFWDLSFVIPKDPSLLCSWGELRENSMIWKFIPGVIFWSIWKVRNAMVFNGSSLDRLSLFFIVRFRLSKWFLAKFPKISIQEDVLIGNPCLADGFSLSKRKECRVIRWFPPLVDFLKMNVDGAVTSDGLGGGIVGILRDWNCCTLLTFSEKVAQGNPPLVELKAIKRDIDLFLSSRWEAVGRLIVETDCKSTVEWIQAPGLAHVFLMSIVYQISTLITGKISLLEECGFLERALEELHHKEPKIVDKLTYKEQVVSLLVKLGRLEEGANLYKALLIMNPDNYRSSTEATLNLALGAAYYPTSPLSYCIWELGFVVVVVVRIPLDFLQGDKFREAAVSYIKPLLTKADMIEQLILELEHSIRNNGRYTDRTEKEPPSTLLWILFFLAQHYDRRGQYDVALSKIDEAIQHTPTVIDLYSVKSRILKHAGDFSAAASLANEARCMDLADRYINSECVKRLLQADQVALAEKTATLFTKDGDQHNNLHDMQCMWYELALGESYFRQGDLGRALKKFLAVEKHYADITEDQFDFHSYCLRKMTLRAYVEMLKFQDRLHSHVYFHKAAAGAIRWSIFRCVCVLLHIVDHTCSGASFWVGLSLPPFFPFSFWGIDCIGFRCIHYVLVEDHLVECLTLSSIGQRCYLKLYDSPLNSPTEEEDNTSKTPSQKKKMKKQRKAERAKKEADGKSEESSASGNSKFGKRHIKPVDADPYGEKLLKTEDPLSEATKYLKLLRKHSPDSLETHLLSFEVNMRKQKILLAFQAVKQLLRLDAENPDSHCCLIKFFHKVDSMPAPVTDAEKLVWSVLEAERPSISQLQDKTLSESNEVFLGKHEDSLMHRVAVAEMLHVLDPTKKLKAVKLIEGSSNEVVPKNGALGSVMGWKLKDCIAVHRLLDKVLTDQDAALRWKVRCAEYFPYSTYFEGSRSSALQNSLNNMDGETTVNGDPSHPEISGSESAATSNGKLEAFKNLTI